MQSNRYFGEFGGCFVPQLLMPCLRALEEAFISLQKNPEFQKRLTSLLTTYAGRPTPLYLCENILQHPSSKLYLKREDLVHGGAHKTNQVLAQGIIAQLMGKKRLIAETGAGQHGVATAMIGAKLNLPTTVYMGAKDIARQETNVARMKMFGATVISVTTGTQTLKDAVNEAIRDWVTDSENTHYCLGSAVGPHPYPLMVREFQKIIGIECKNQILQAENAYPNEVIACVGGGSNAIGIFHPFIENTSVKLIGVEAAGKGLDVKHASAMHGGRVGIFQGTKSLFLQTDDNQIQEPYSISAGLDYPGVGPEHSHLKQSGRAEYTTVTDDEAVHAYKLLAQTEGILPALESAHAIAYAIKSIEADPNHKIVVVNLSGRGDKDMQTVSQYQEFKESAICD